MSINPLSLIKTKENVLKLVSNAKKGTIKVYNEKGKLILKKSSLTKEQIKIIEESFIGIILKKINEFKENQKNRNDPMVA